MTMQKTLVLALGFAAVLAGFAVAGCTESTEPVTPTGFAGVVYGVGDGRSFVADFYDANCHFDQTPCEEKTSARRIYTSNLDSAYVQFENALFWSCYAEIAPRYGCYDGTCSEASFSVARIGGQDLAHEFVPPGAGSQFIIVRPNDLSENASQHSEFDMYGAVGAANVCGPVRAAYQSIQLCMGYRYLAMSESVSGATISRRGARFPTIIGTLETGLQVRDVVVAEAGERDGDEWSERFPPASSGAASATFPWFNVAPQDDSGAATLAYQALSHFRNSAQAGSDLLRPECGNTELAYRLPAERVGPGLFPMDAWDHTTQVGTSSVITVGDVAVANFADAAHMLDESFAVFQRHVLAAG